MDCVAFDRDEQQSKLDLILGTSREVSSKEKSAKEWDEHYNEFLDRILNIKSFLQTTTDDIGALIIKAEQITWFPNVDIELLEGIEELMGTLEGLYKAMNRNYYKFAAFCLQHSIAKEELENYKSVTDDVIELANDFRAIFFVLPANEEFQALNQALNDL